MTFFRTMCGDDEGAADHRMAATAKRSTRALVRTDGVDDERAPLWLLPVLVLLLPLLLGGVGIGSSGSGTPL